jgi:hypothetical protein
MANLLARKPGSRIAGDAFLDFIFRENYSKRAGPVRAQTG